jgi:hypothetical protein
MGADVRTGQPPGGEPRCGELSVPPPEQFGGAVRAQPPPRPRRCTARTPSPGLGRGSPAGSRGGGRLGRRPVCRRGRWTTRAPEAGPRGWDGCGWRRAGPRLRGRARRGNGRGIGPGPWRLYGRGRCRSHWGLGPVPRVDPGAQRRSRLQVTAARSVCGRFAAPPSRPGRPRGAWGAFPGPRGRAGVHRRRKALDRACGSRTGAFRASGRSSEPRPLARPPGVRCAPPRGGREGVRGLGEGDGRKRASPGGRASGGAQ